MAPTLYRYATFCICAAVFLSGCGIIRRGKEPEVGKAEVSGEASAVFPAPVAVAAPAQTEPAVTSDFVERLRLADPAITTVVRASVQEVSVLERALPQYVWPEADESIIVTKATVLITEVLDGPPLSGSVDVYYVGGRVEGRAVRTSLMPSDLAPRQEYLLVLTTVDGEHFLVGGQHEVLVPAPDDPETYTDYAGREVLRSAILGAVQ